MAGMVTQASKKYKARSKSWKIKIELNIVDTIGLKQSKTFENHEKSTFFIMHMRAHVRLTKKNEEKKKFVGQRLGVTPNC